MIKAPATERVIKRRRRIDILRLFCGMLPA
jgi:hypothetical protein